MTKSIKRKEKVSKSIKKHKVYDSLVEITYFCPLAQLWVVSEDFHGWLSVRVVGRLKTQPLNSY